MKFSVSSLYDWYRSTIRNPKYRWWIIIGTLVYILSPFDISPDVFPIVGQVDDAIVITLLLTEVSQIAIESLKKRQNKTQTASAETEGTTVDVDSVSVDG